MRPLDDMFSSPTSSPSSSTRPNKSSRPASIIASRSPSPGTRTTATAAAGGPGLTTFFLTEENNFGVHSMSESHLSMSPSPSRSPTMTMDAEIIEVGKTGGGGVDVMGAIPAHVFDHVHTPSIGSNVSPTISTPSSPHHNLSSSAISDDSELDISSLHEGEEQASASVSVGDSISSSFPQLVMPRVNMPRRKAFTDAGRTMGKLKIMVVGDSGIGKSSLIQAILHTSPDIVHYDPAQPAMSSSSSSSSFLKPSLSRRATLETDIIPPTENILEIRASTRAYPTWWKVETERDTKNARPPLARRESVGEVLERNICFVDTPGYGSSDDFNDVFARVSGYIEENYDRVNNLLNASTSRQTDLLTLFSNGINCVDLVIYVVLHRLKPVDITIMRHLSTLTNIIPVIAKSDSLSHTQTLTLKLSLLRDLRANSIPIFTFGKSFSELERTVVNGLPWSVSCLADESAEMDASLLMRDDAPLHSYVDSDLPLLTSSLVENAAWLRYTATKKFLDWRTKREEPMGIMSLSPSQSLAQSTMSLVSLPHTEGYAMARVGDHMDREERLARVRLVQWAGDMRRGIRQKMTMERLEFEQLEHQQRVKWLLERLNEAVDTQQSVPPSTRTALVPIRTGRRGGRRTGMDRDPLGLVWVKERWGPRVQRGVMWFVEAGVVVGSGWVVWKYLVESGLSGWIIQNARNAGP